MKGLNRVYIMGRLGSAPELFESKGGRHYVRLRIATNRARLVDEKYEETSDWHSVFAWGKLAETCAEHLRKGAIVMIEGQLNYWQDTEAEKTLYRTSIQALDVQFQNPPKTAPTAEPLDKDEGARNHDAVAHPA